MAVLRKAELVDVKAITAIYNQAIKTGKCTCDIKALSEQDRINWFNKHGERTPVFVCEVDGAVVGYSYLSAYRDGRGAADETAEISHYFDFAFHGLGYGKTLVMYTVEEAKKLGYKNLLAIILDCNKASVEFTKKLGFSLWGTLPGVAKINGRQHSHLYYGLKI